jgi:hypothetical protein
MVDDGSAIHYTAVSRGTRVYGSDGTAVGEVRQIVDNYREHILDGVVIRTDDGRTVFADAPEVARTAERGVTLTITAAEARELPAPEDGAASFRAKPGGGRLSRLFGSGWKRDR